MGLQYPGTPSRKELEDHTELPVERAALRGSSSARIGGKLVRTELHQKPCQASNTSLQFRYGPLLSRVPCPAGIMVQLQDLGPKAFRY